MGTWRAGVAIAGAAALALGGGAFALAARDGDGTTVEGTIRGNANNRLEHADGEDHVVRQELAPASSGRASRRRHHTTFGQLTDKHLIDEESPARVEFLDRLGSPFTSAYRPQEGISPQVANEMVRQMRDARGVEGDELERVMTTGDNSDNTQLNEVRWFIDLLDGDRQIDPDSGDPDAPCAGIGPGAPETGDDRRYDGVRGGGEYYEPDSSTGAGAGNDVEDGPGYSPNEAENRAKAGRSNQVRDYRGLFEAQNLPFRAVGLDVPWYGILGNHDALLQGNQPRNEALEAVATGCLKASNLSPPAATALEARSRNGFSRKESAEALDLAVEDLVSKTASSASTTVVPADPERRPLKKPEYIEEHLEPDRQGDGHGFDERNVKSGMGNYVLRPREGLRLLVLDSINEGGGDGGNIDDRQFRWMHRELRKAEQREELAMIFAHHSLETMDQLPQSPFGQGDQGGNESPDVHYGLRLPSSSREEPCATTDAREPTTPDETVRCLLLRHRSVVAFVNGHEHNNRVDPFERRTEEGFPPDGGGFWEVNTASHIDWPQQSRLIDLFDNCDRTLSIFGTVLDHAAPPRPGGGGLPTGGDASRGEVTRLASISRELAFNDPQADNGEDGFPDRRGRRKDRNVELLVRDPYPDSGCGPRSGDEEDGGDSDEGGEDAGPGEDGDGAGEGGEGAGEDDGDGGRDGDGDGDGGRDGDEDFREVGRQIAETLSGDFYENARFELSGRSPSALRSTRSWPPRRSEGRLSRASGEPAATGGPLARWPKPGPKLHPQGDSPVVLPPVGSRARASTRSRTPKLFVPLEPVR